MTSKADPASEDLVWDVYKSLTAQCEHFNSIESTYRTLASTWLLAAFAGIGFIMKDIQSEDVPLFIAAVASAAAIGIFLLWLLDLMVYHRLLGAAFAEQLALEKRHAWLPQVAHGMMGAHGGAGVVPKIVWFYIASYSLLIGIASVALVHGAVPTWSVSMQFLAMAGCFVVCGGAVALYMHSSATSRTKEHAEFKARNDDKAA
jgi:hypothetical protein